MANTDRQLNGRIGALESWARTTDRTARTAPARSAFLSRFDDAEDPAAARRAYFLRLAAKSAEARRKQAS